MIAGRGLPPGVDGIDGGNDLAAAPGLFRDPARGDLRLTAGRSAPEVQLPEFGWADSGGVAP